MSWFLYAKVTLFQGCVTPLAKLIALVMAPTAIVYLPLIGSVLIFCIRVNLMWGKKTNLVNILPAVLLAI